MEFNQSVKNAREKALRRRPFSQSGESATRTKTRGAHLTQRKLSTWSLVQRPLPVGSDNGGIEGLTN